eukprot:TRINITY_DN11768_c0_g1_i1.p1 TRINITY_DN11768_c0_g1~~TRINITY_DN11768_c0_g1_i1.p1  ORF type:complete len:212 (+),score=46.89 TRINITY_DN11768_c0_g1_i1:60-695(+)
MATASDDSKLTYHQLICMVDDLRTELHDIGKQQIPQIGVPYLTISRRQQLTILSVLGLFSVAVAVALLSYHCNSSSASSFCAIKPVLILSPVSLPHFSFPLTLLFAMLSRLFVPIMMLIPRWFSSLRHYAVVARDIGRWAHVCWWPYAFLLLLTCVSESLTYWPFFHMYLGSLSGLPLLFFIFTSLATLTGLLQLVLFFVAIVERAPPKEE